MLYDALFPADSETKLLGELHVRPTWGPVPHPRVSYERGGAWMLHYWPTSWRKERRGGGKGQCSLFDSRGCSTLCTDDRNTCFLSYLYPPTLSISLYEPVFLPRDLCTCLPVSVPTFLPDYLSTRTHTHTTLEKLCVNSSEKLLYDPLVSPIKTRLHSPAMRYWYIH